MLDQEQSPHLFQSSIQNTEVVFMLTSNPSDPIPYLTCSMSLLSLMMTKIFSAKNCCPCFCLEYLVMFRMVMCNSINLKILVHCIQMVAPPLLEFLTLLTAMHVCLERSSRGRAPSRGRSNEMKQSYHQIIHLLLLTQSDEQLFRQIGVEK